MDEKQKRLRTHVVKEIVETERVYCGQIRFVTEVSGSVLRAGRQAVDSPLHPGRVGVAAGAGDDRLRSSTGRTQWDGLSVRVCACGGLLLYSSLLGGGQQQADGATHRVQNVGGVSVRMLERKGRKGLCASWFPRLAMRRSKFASGGDEHLYCL